MVCDEELAIRVLQGWRQQHGGGLNGGRQEGLLANLQGWQQQEGRRVQRPQQGQVGGSWDDEGPSSSSTATRAAEEDDEVLAHRLGHFR